MACCTYLDGDAYTAPTSDAELNSLLAAVRAATGRDWRIRELIIYRRRLFRRPIGVKVFELLIGTNGPEFQMINFYRPDIASGPYSSISVLNEARYVAAYLYDVLAGARRTEGTPP